MKEAVNISVDNDVLEKFRIALQLNGETFDDATETLMRQYISKTFEQISQSYSPKSSARNYEAGYAAGASADREYYGKAIGRIPVWAVRPNQYNHKIIRAFFAAEELNGEATLPVMEQLCSDVNDPSMYVPTFRSNYAQMKLDGPKTHGKVFEDDGERVRIWSEVEDTLMQYKNEFYNGEEQK